MKNKLIFIGLALLCFTLYEMVISFGVFETKVSSEADLNIAKWNITVNESDLTDSNKTFYVNDITYIDKDGNTTDKIAPGVSGEFLLIIKPNDTEVAFEYDLSVDLSSYEQFVLDEVSGQNGLVLTNNDGVYHRLFTLSEINKGVYDTIKVKFHWEWNDSYNESDSALGSIYGNKFSIPITINFKQFIE